MLNILGPSWRTSLTGLLTLLASVGGAAKLLMAGNFNFNDPLWIALATSFVQSLGLLAARDNKVSTEQVEAAANK
jgi:hypothetical protein